MYYAEWNIIIIFASMVQFRHKRAPVRHTVAFSPEGVSFLPLLMFKSLTGQTLFSSVGRISTDRTECDQRPKNASRGGVAKKSPTPVKDTKYNNI
jgi:hypothetical protein